MKIQKSLFITGTIIYTLISFVSCNPSATYNSTTLHNNWAIQSQDKISDSGETISSANYATTNWTETTAPNTILAGLVEAGVYNDIYKDNNLEKIDTTQFRQPWWYRTQFNITEVLFHQLVFEGINYRANVWLNGKLIADSSKIEGAFGIWKLDVTEYITKGANTLAIQVFPPKFNDLTIGFVDWNPAPPDKNLGIWRPVKIETTGTVSIDEPFVKTAVNTETLSEAKLTITTQVKNHSTEKQKVKIVGSIGQIHFEKIVELQPNESKKIEFNPTDYKQLVFENPKLWWPNLIGEPNLYNLNLRAQIKTQVTDAKEVRFGIRKIEDYWTKENHKGYKINGKKILIKGAGWVDNILLADPDEKVAAQMEYAKHMNLNCVRLEGFWGRNKTLYNKADELGLLLMIGWSCHWEWEGYCGRYEDNYMCIRSPKDMELQARAYQSQVKWLRNHPSIFTWVFGSDKLPLPKLEEKLNKYIGEVDPTRPILASCKYEDFDLKRDKQNNIIVGYINNSEISGPTGVKMTGPYAYTTPNYWYIDKKAGGAYGFNTETGPGAQVPPIESIKKMFSEDNLWPFNKMWDYHSGRNEFATLDRYNKAFNARYGKPTGVEDYAFRSQISNYEAIRAMFEAFEVNKNITTGIVQWMLNSAWPEFFWQLFDYYLMPNGAFYGTKKACQPINIIYNYGNKNIYATNSTLNNYSQLIANVSVYDINSNIIYSNKNSIDLNENSSQLIFEMPELTNLSSTYFIDLSIWNNNEKIAGNFYWLSTKNDVHNWDKSAWVGTPYKSYADFKGLNTMPKTEVKYEFTKSTDTNGNTNITCSLENSSDKIAFFIELSVKDKKTKQTILPVFWSDNYISLMPGEKRVIKAELQKEYIKNKEITYHLQGLNVK